MNYSYNYKVTFSLNEPFDVDYVNKVIDEHPDRRVLIEVQNTKGISSHQLMRLRPKAVIRVAGGYDEDRVKRFKHFKYKSGETGEYFTTAVIYSRNELIKIVQEIEKIESGLNPNWSSLQKAMYVYDRLKTGIMYDPKFEQKFSSEIRTLRGLVTKNTVCAGYAMIFKEIMDRNGITCEYVSGFTQPNQSGCHAWNILEIAGKKYPIDLTWDNTNFRDGKFNSFDFLGQDVESFSKSHVPRKGEKTQDYINTLSQIDKGFIRQFYNQINGARDFKSTTYHGVRKDGSRYLVAQIGTKDVDGDIYYRYYYASRKKDGTLGRPIIVYSETNITHLVECKKFKEYIPPNYEEAVDDMLFSMENLTDSYRKGTAYIGKVNKAKRGNKPDIITSISEISKPDDKKELFNLPFKIFTRSDGTVFIAQKLDVYPMRVSGADIYSFDIFEMVNENGVETLKKNTVYTERDFLNDPRMDIPDDMLSRSRLDKKVKSSGGYIGHITATGARIYDPRLVEYFSDNRGKGYKMDKPSPIPEFYELKALASTYELVMEGENVRIFNRHTKKFESDQILTERAIFANIWVSAAGLRSYHNEPHPGYTYAFNDQAEILYNTIRNELDANVKNNGVIDTVDLLRNIESKNGYSHSPEIIVNLFRSPYQTEIINRIFLHSNGINMANDVPETLYNMGYAGNLAFNNAQQRSALSH